PIYSLRRANVVMQSSAVDASQSEASTQSKDPYQVSRSGHPRSCPTEGAPFFAFFAKGGRDRLRKRTNDTAFAASPPPLQRTQEPALTFPKGWGTLGWKSAEKHP